MRYLSGGKSDKKEYASLNIGGLEVLLISNHNVPGTEKKSAAAMAVEVGSFSDPEEVEGLSHFLEHMLFMGSAVYPGENEYDKFVSDNGGYDNAYTEGEHTVYNFEINAENFEKALDMFAQSFISATLLQNSVKREILAIESEFQLALMSDPTRVEEVMGAQAQSGHFFRKFGWGNLDSLDKIPGKNGVDVMSCLRAHYQTYYRPHQCKLVVLSSQSIPDIEQCVRRSFGGWNVEPSPLAGQFASKNAHPTYAAPFPHPSRLTRICPVKNNVHEVKITWTIPASIRGYRTRCEDMIGHLVGHEGEGSVLSALRALGLATDITAGVSYCEVKVVTNSYVYVDCGLFWCARLEVRDSPATLTSLSSK
jgi:secreted Zn-dependent insulinase-like peptidase